MRRLFSAVPGVPRVATIVAALTATAVLAVSGCSSTSELQSGPISTTTPPKAEVSDLEQDAISAGAVGIQQLEDLVARLLASTDTCTILTQRDVRENQLDPTLFTSTSARRVLAEGLVQVFDHLIRISPLTIRQPLEDQKATYTQVLEVVEQYANNPNAPDATDAINDVVNQPGFIEAQAQLNVFILQNCP